MIKKIYALIYYLMQLAAIRQGQREEINLDPHLFAVNVLPRNFQRKNFTLFKTFFCKLFKNNSSKKSSHRKLMMNHETTKNKICVSRARVSCIKCLPTNHLFRIFLYRKLIEIVLRTLESGDNMFPPKEFEIFVKKTNSKLSQLVIQYNNSSLLFLHTTLDPTSIS